MDAFVMKQVHRLVPALPWEKALVLRRASPSLPAQLAGRPPSGPIHPALSPHHAHCFQQPPFFARPTCQGLMLPALHPATTRHVKAICSLGSSPQVRLLGFLLSLVTASSLNPPRPSIALGSVLWYHNLAFDFSCSKVKIQTPSGLSKSNRAFNLFSLNFWFGHQIIPWFISLCWYIVVVFSCVYLLPNYNVSF